MTASASWPSMATRRRRGSTRRPMPCTRASAPPTRPNPPTSRRSTAIPREEREIAAANVQKAVADIAAVQSIIDQMVVYAPVAAQVYKRNVEPGEYVSPGVPLITLDRSRRHVGPLRSARGPGQDAQGRRPLRRAHSGARRSPHHRRGQADRARRANMRAGAPPAPPAISTCGRSRSAPTRSTRCRSCGPA